jgi:hypothetical protein
LQLQTIYSVSERLDAAGARFCVEAVSNGDEFPDSVDQTDNLGTGGLPFRERIVAHGN